MCSSVYDASRRSVYRIFLYIISILHTHHHLVDFLFAHKSLTQNMISHLERWRISDKISTDGEIPSNLLASQNNIIYPLHVEELS